MDKQHVLSKAEEAAQFRAFKHKHDAVPSYSEHTADDLYTENIPNYGTGFPSLLYVDRELTYDQDSYNDLQRDSVLKDDSSIQPPLTETTPSEPLSLTLDKALIFPNTIPATALYSLNYTLNTMGNSVTISRSVPGTIRNDGTSSKITDKDLYNITRPPLSLLEFQIHGKRKSTFSGTGNLQMKTGLMGKYWECRFKDKLVLRGKYGTWCDKQGRVVAREVNEVVAKKVSSWGKEVERGVRENPGLVFEVWEEDGRDSARHVMPH
jgi:hypothetical protein